MRRKKIAAYFLVIASLLSLSVVLPLVINAASGYVSGKIRGMDRGKDTETAGFETENDSSVNIADGGSDDEDGAEMYSQKEKAQTDKGSIHDRDSVVDVPYFDEPVFDSPKEEDAANEKAYRDMTEKLASLSEASAAYRERFHPAYDELSPGLMNEFISGMESVFYEDIANYCFGHYNTTHPIERVRFAAITEDTEERKTVIVEFFTAQSIEDEFSVPDLAYCTYNKKAQAFVFFTSA